MIRIACLALLTAVAAAGCGTSSSSGRSLDGGEPTPIAAEPEDYTLRLWANRVAQGDPDPAARRGLVAAGKRSTPALLDLVARAAAPERERLLPLIVEIRDERAIPVLIDLLSPTAPEVREALRSLSGVDRGPRRSDWLAWWRATGQRISAEEHRRAKEAFLAEPRAAQQEILKALVRELADYSLVVQRDSHGTEPVDAPRQFDAAAPEDVRKRLAAVPVLEAVLDQADERNLIYASPLARQIGEPALPVLRKALESALPAARQAAAKALSELTPEPAR